MTTRAEYVAYGKTFIGGYGPARGLSNNDNQFNTKYYGRRVSGDDYAWCRVFEWYLEDHFGIAALNGGKTAYVPNGPAVARSVGAKVWRKPRARNSPAWQPGNKVDLDFNDTGEAEHTGTYLRHESDSVIITLEANTSTSQYSDAVAEKRRNVSDVLYVIETLGLDGQPHQEEDMPTYVSVYKTAKSRQEELTAGEWEQVYFDKNGSAGAKAHHDAGDHPSIVSGPADYTGDVTVVIEGLPAGTPGQIRPLYVGADGKVASEGANITEFLGSDGRTYVRLPATGYVGDGQRLRVEVTHFGPADLKPLVTGGEVHFQVFERK